MKCLIVTGGEIIDDFACDVIKNGGYEIIIAVDAGMEFFARVGVEPDIIVGDFDSVESSILEKFREKEYIEMCVLNPVKDETDTEYAVHEAVRRGADSITILGGTGTRLDHVLGNIGLLGIGLDEEIDVELLDVHNRVRMLNKGITLRKKEQYGKYVSLLPYSPEICGLTIRGMKYNVENVTLKSSEAKGVSNEMVEDEASISFENGVLLLIESRD